MKCLIELGADIKRQDTQGNNMVTLSALRFHTNVLEFLIEWNNPSVPVWKVLVGKQRNNPSVPVWKVLVGEQRNNPSVPMWKVLVGKRSNNPSVPVCKV